MNRLERAIRDHQNAIKAIDRAALANVLQQYQAIAERLNPQIELLVQEIAGQNYASLSQLMRVTRMQELQRQFRVEMNALATATGQITNVGVERAVTQAIESAEATTAASLAGNSVAMMSSYNRIHPMDVRDFVGATQSGPLAELLASFGETIERSLIQTLTDGIALGTNPRDIGDMIHKSTEIGRNRALTIARTEILRAHRSATLQNYQANADILKGWIWISAKQTRTCAACLAMDGTFHELDETMASHPNCRCTMRPALKNDPMRKVQTGKQWLDKQPPEAQDAVLGKAGGAAYRAGEVELQDFVKVTESADWGKTTTDGGVAFARMNAARRIEGGYAMTSRRQSSRMETERVDSEFNREAFQLQGNSDTRRWIESAPRDEFEAIENYKASGYSAINGHLRFGKEGFAYIGPNSVQTPVETLVKRIDSAIGANTLPSDAKLYRGMTSGTDEWASLKPGSLIQDKGFVSTTFDVDVANSFSGGSEGSYFLTIYAPSGSKGMFLDEVYQGTSTKEAEVLLPRGTLFRVIETKPYVHPRYGVRGTKEIVLEVLP